MCNFSQHAYLEHNWQLVDHADEWAGRQMRQEWVLAEKLGKWSEGGGHADEADITDDWIGRSWVDEAGGWYEQRELASRWSRLGWVRVRKLESGVVGGEGHADEADHGWCNGWGGKGWRKWEPGGRLLPVYKSPMEWVNRMGWPAAGGQAGSVRSWNICCIINARPAMWGYWVDVHKWFFMCGCWVLLEGWKEATWEDGVGDGREGNRMYQAYGRAYLPGGVISTQMLLSIRTIKILKVWMLGWWSEPRCLQRACAKYRVG